MFPTAAGGQPRSTNDALLIAFPFPATAGHERKKDKKKNKSRAFYILNNEREGMGLDDSSATRLKKTG
jgi:hypothetical protein